MIQTMFLYHLTILQLENYDLQRFWRAISQRYFPATSLRQKPIWTTKLTAIAILADILICAQTIAIFIIYNAFWALTSIIISIILFPVYLTLAIFLLLPFDIILKNLIIFRAKRKIALFPKITIIGITGSYGKTTMKEIIATVLAEKYTVLKTPDSVNTPVGIARLILDKLDASIHIMIIEMGAHHKRDIATLCALTPPDIAMLTGINEAHLERFGMIENTIAAKCEIIDHAKNGAFCVLNADDERVMRAYSTHTKGRKIALYSALTNNTRAGYAPEGDIRVSSDGCEQSFTIRSAIGASYETRTALLGNYAVGAIAGAIAVAERLGLTHDEILRGIAMIRPIPHRLEPFLASGNVLVIDDSYNGNPNGAREAIATLGRFTDRRKIYCTPGLVEMGAMKKKTHESIGAQLAKTADLVILITTSATRHIKHGLLAAGFNKNNIVEFPTARAAHAALPSILVSGDVILFQNDWPDNYF